ncbi:MAG TPA: hypothetical protein VEQ61_05235 [Thermoleophilaceae bacterium]|nr:hypothetical protein [Thermoleophilaceae bacterium]
MQPSKPTTTLLIGGAGAAAAIGIRVARSLHDRWRVLPGAERERLEPLAREAKRRALELRGTLDRQAASQELRASSETLAAALLESAEKDPGMGAEEVRGLREELRSELERLAGADIKASRMSRRPSPSPE